MSELEETINKQITKAKFDEIYKENLIQVEDALYKQLEQLKALQNSYIALLDFRRTYRKDYKTHRIKHMFNFDKGILTYIPQEKRQIGYKLSKKKNNGK